MTTTRSNSSVGQAFVDEIHKQVQEDKPIWENKAHLVRPALADSDGPFMKFRRWASQFYAEGVDDSVAGLRATGQLPGRGHRDRVAQARLGPLRPHLIPSSIPAGLRGGDALSACWVAPSSPAIRRRVGVAPRTRGTVRGAAGCWLVRGVGARPRRRSRR